MIYINDKLESEHRKRLKRLQEALGCAMQSAYACFYEPLEANETLEDRAVHVKEKLFSQAAAALVASWEGDGADFVEYLRLLYQQGKGCTVAQTTVISVPVSVKVGVDAQGRKSIEWIAEGSTPKPAA